MRDGTVLAADVFLLDDRRRRPVLLVRTPYSRAAARTALDPVSIARDGWAMVIQDVRGLGDSEGEFAPFLQEISDGEDTIEWCASQPWSDGRVAMCGGSYLGAAQWLAATTRHPALSAIAPTFTASDYRDGWTYEGGAFAHGFVTPWATKFAASSRHAALVERSKELSTDWNALLGRPLRGNGVAEVFPPYATWLDPHDDPYWNAVSVERRYDELDVPAIHVGGWYDIFCEGTIRNYTGMSTRAPTARTRRLQRLVIGPWTHHAPWERVQGDLDFGAEADGTMDMPRLLVDWLRSTLDGGEPACGAAVFVMGENRWVELESWPPPTQPLRLYLAAERPANGPDGDGRLLPRASNAEVQTFTSDPGDPVPTVGGRGIDPVVQTAGPRDQREIEARGDVLVYTSDPLPRGFTIIGLVTASLQVSADTAGADVTVKLCVVEPDELSINVVDSIRREPYVPARVQRVDLDVGTTALAVPAGARLRVQVSGSNFPRFDRNPSISDSGSVAEISIHSDKAHPSWIELPIAPGAAERTLVRAG
ncbi:MAG: CocE/NonD family hydrolase [Gaiellaceae bacterium]